MFEKLCMLFHVKAFNIVGNGGTLVTTIRAADDNKPSGRGFRGCDRVPAHQT